MSAEEEEKDTGFRIKDRRRFTESGDPRGDEDESESHAESEESAAQHAAQEAAESRPSQSMGAEEIGPGSGTGGPDNGPGAEPGSGAEQTGITFLGFINGFALQALMALGLIPDAASGVIRQDLAEACAMIDIIAMLREKTAGNLSEEEDRMMEEMLYDLRMHYVRGIRGETGSQGEE